MLLVLDVHYTPSGSAAKAAGLLFDDWASGTEHSRLVMERSPVEPYVPGEFYKRELPCILPIVEEVLRGPHGPDLRAVIVDSFVDLGPNRAGLGRHLFAAIDAAVPVVGVAKKPFHGANGIPVVRGKSNKPLFVTATERVGEYAKAVESMHGAHRLPTLLKRVDSLARHGEVNLVVP